jgi:hypothetical protein
MRNFLRKKQEVVSAKNYREVFMPRWYILSRNSKIFGILLCFIISALAPILKHLNNQESLCYKVLSGGRLINF